MYRTFQICKWNNSGLSIDETILFDFVDFGYVLFYYFILFYIFYFILFYLEILFKQDH